MKRIAWMGLLAAGALSGGCVPKNYILPTAPPVEAEKPAAKAEASRPAFRPPVTAGQITSANAQEKAQALRDEINQDMTSVSEAGGAKKE
jgi:hypothetical protein